MMDELEAIQRRLTWVRREINVASARLQQLKEEERGLALSVARLSGSWDQGMAASHASQALRSSRQTRLTPTVRSLLIRAGGPMTRHEIAEQLSETGLQASLDAVSASLSYLRRTGAVHNADGHWYAAAGD
jgi:hypothetical protein